jgi:hypothetical protein
VWNRHKELRKWLQVRAELYKGLKRSMRCGTFATLETERERIFFRLQRRGPVEVLGVDVRAFFTEDRRHTE